MPFKYSIKGRSVAFARALHQICHCPSANIIHCQDFLLGVSDKSNKLKTGLCHRNTMASGRKFFNFLTEDWCFLETLIDEGLPHCFCSALWEQDHAKKKVWFTFWQLQSLLATIFSCYQVTRYCIFVTGLDLSFVLLRSGNRIWDWSTGRVRSQPWG